MSRWTLIAVFALVASEALAQTGTDAIQAYTQGYAAVTKKDWATAIPLLEKASTSADLFASHFWLGVAYQAQNDAAKSFEQFQAFIAKASGDPGSAELVYKATRESGLMLAKQNKLAEAMPFLEKSVAAQSSDPEVLYLLGQALMQAGNKEKAEEHFVKVTELSPKSPLPFLLAGRLAYERKDDAAAKQRLENYVALAPDSPKISSIYLMLGNLALRTKDSAGAIAHFEKYLVANPTGTQADAVRKNLEGLKAGALAATPSEAPAAAQ